MRSLPTSPPLVSRLTTHYNQMTVHLPLPYLSPLQWASQLTMLGDSWWDSTRARLRVLMVSAPGCSKPVPPSYVDYFTMTSAWACVYRWSSDVEDLPFPCAEDDTSLWLQGLQTCGTDLSHHVDPGETGLGAGLALGQTTLGPPTVCPSAQTWSW